MTRMLEITAKALLRDAGVRIPLGATVTSSTELHAALEGVPPPYFVKAQLALGDRAALGAVRSAPDAHSAVEVATEMFASTFAGLRTQSILVETAVEARWTGYAAVRVDDHTKARVVILEAGGGSGFDPAASEPLLRLGRTVEAHEVRTALAKRGHHSSELVVLTEFVVALAKVASAWCTQLIEINPFAVTDGGVVALDAKAEIDDYSVSLVPAVAGSGAEPLTAREERAFRAQVDDHSGTLRYVQIIPDHLPHRRDQVGSHAVGGGESMILMDALADAGLRATNYCDTSGSPSQQKVAIAAAIIASQPHIAGYFFSSCIANQPLSVTARGLVDGFTEAGWTGPTVVRIAGNEEAEAIQIVSAWGETVQGPVTVLGRETDEWTAARLLADALRKDDD